MSRLIISPTVVSVFAALAGVALGAFLTHYLSWERTHLKMKRDVLRRVLGYRWQLTPGRTHRDGPVFTALNEIPIVFAGDKDVENAVTTFREAVNGVSEPSISVLLYELWRNQPRFHTRAGAKI